MSTWRSWLSWLLLVALVATVVVLAASYTLTISYSVTWSANYEAFSAPARYVQYGLAPLSSWTLSSMPWYSGVKSFTWIASWSLSLMPVSATMRQVSWYAQWAAWPVIVYSYPYDKTITVEPDVSVSVEPLGGAWRGYIVLAGYGGVKLGLPAGVELVPLGKLTYNGTYVYVNGSGKLLQRVNCLLLSVENGQGQTVAASATFNGTKLVVGSSMKCIIGAKYNVEVPGYDVANIKMNEKRFYLPFVPVFLNTTDYYLKVVAADPTTVVITRITAQPTAAGYVQIVVNGYVYDNITGYRIPGGQVTLYYNGIPYDISVTGRDGSFVSVMTEKVSGTIKLRVEFMHPDYQASSANVEYNVVPSGTGTSPGAEFPSQLDIAVIVVSIILITLAIIMIKRVRAKTRALVDIDKKEWFE